ncbi:MAG: SemiSWEET transporter [Saprospiraceae bacterium]|nr:SemiSWEET transporter [Saprospiraceae bacterium]
MEMIDILGLLAAALTTSAFFPQVIKTYKTKSVEDISLVMYLILVTGVILWLIYGLIIMNLPLIFANIITLNLAITIIVFKIKYGAPKN